MSEDEEPASTVGEGARPWPAWLEARAARAARGAAELGRRLTRATGRAVDLAERRSLWLMALSAAFCWWLNFDQRPMDGLYPAYEDHARVIASGFDLSKSIHTNYTFPMWGYGWLLALCDLRVVLQGCQLTLAVFATARLLQTIDEEPLWRGAATRCLRLWLIVQVPWWALHLPTWPLSLAASLLLLSFSELLRAARLEDARSYLRSALCFGLALNFRSDAILMPLGLCALTLWCRPSRAHLKALARWLGLIYLCLTPWCLYSYSVTGSPRLTSTNGGHVLFIGLGQLEKNPWGITPVDGDPLMRSLVTDAFGPGCKTVSHQADVLLRRAWRARVRQHPRAFLHKCWRNLRATAETGVYVGYVPFVAHHFGVSVLGPYQSSALVEGEVEAYTRFINRPLLERLSRLARGEGRSRRYQGVQLLALLDWDRWLLRVQRLLACLDAYYLTTWVTWLSCLCLPFTLAWAIARRELAACLFTASLAYQVTLNSVGFASNFYSAMLYPLHLAQLCFVLCAIGALIRGSLRGRLTAAP